jgi:serine/threonine-protein kinase
MIDRLLSHYKIVSQLGEGGMGVVYKAHDEHLDRWVAIKMLAPGRMTEQDRRRLQLEAKLASALNHPNIVVIHDITSEGETDFIVMEFVDGRPLRELIPTGGMPVDEVTKIGVQMADAIACAHEHGVIHRDLKPGNILVTADKRVKVLDFGLAKSDLRDPGEATATIGLSGTASYMAPEQIQGMGASPASDIFSLGIVLYEMLSGQRPFRGETSGAVMGSILFEDPKPLGELRPDAPEELAQCIMECLRKGAADRIGSAAQLRRALMSLRLESSRSGTLSRSVVERKPSLVVLPFTTRGSGEDHDYFGEGLAEEIINALTRLPNLRVIARASAFAFQGPGYDIDAIREKLKVDYLLDGSVRHNGSRMRVTVSLIRTNDASLIWSERFDRQITDIFEIQDEISAATVQQLKLQLGGTGPGPHASRATSDIEAYKLYLQGRFFWNRRSWPNLRRGIECFQKALERDPLYADAYSGLADSYNLLGYYNERSPKEAFSQAKAAAQKALEIDPDNSSAHASFGYASLFYDWDWSKADAEFRRALERDPENARAHHWQAWYFFATRQAEQGIASMQRAHDRDPLAPIVNDHLALALSLAGRHDKALRQLQQTAAMAPDFFLAHYRIGWVYLQMGQPQAAVAPLERAVELSEGIYPLGLLGYAYGLTGRRSEALDVSARLESESGSRYVSPLELGLVRAGISDMDGAYAALRRALADRASDFVLFHAYPWSSEMRQDRRFTEVLKAIVPLGSSRE